MRAKVIKKFLDLKSGETRMPGTLFTCSADRFAEIDAKLPGFVEEIKSKQKQKDDVTGGVENDG